MFFSWATKSFQKLIFPKNHIFKNNHINFYQESEGI